VKRLLGLLVLIFMVFIAPTWAMQPSARVSGGVGLTKYGDDLYLAASLYPDIEIGRLGLGLELTLHVGPEGIRAEDWETLGNILGRSVRYIRWAHKGDPLHLVLGTLYTADVGTGILVGNYTNLSPTDTSSGFRRLGVIADADFGRAGIESLVSDLVAPGVYALRLYWRPVSAGAWQALSVGMSVAGDERIHAPYDSLSATAIDAFYPLRGKALEVYAHAARIADHGAGQGLGLRGRAGILLYRAEVRRIGGGFVATPFSHGYEGQGIDWDVFTPDGPATVGLVVATDALLWGGDFIASVQYELNKIGAGNHPRLVVALDGQGGKAHLRTTYTQEGSDAYRHFGAQMRMPTVYGASLDYSYEVVFSARKDPQRSLSVGVSFGH
jgi:hypothetical protein